MHEPDIKKIELEKLASEIVSCEDKWIAISATNTIVSSANTYKETVDGAKKKGFEEVVMFKVPSLDASLAPHTCF